MNNVVLVMVDVVAWGVIHASTGYIVHRLPPTFFERDGWLFRSRRWEAGGRFYVRRLAIRRWKRRLPEAGDLFAGGFDKRTLRGSDDEYLAAYVRETRRAELGHWLAVLPAPLFFFWNPWYAGVIFQLYAVAANGPCIASQRYNRLRLTRILKRRTGGT